MEYLSCSLCKATRLLTTQSTSVVLEIFRIFQAAAFPEIAPDLFKQIRIGLALCPRMKRRLATMQDKWVWRTDRCKPYGTTVLERHRIFTSATIGAEPRSGAVH